MLQHQNALGPIVAHPRSHRWTFLVRPDRALQSIDLYAEMFRLGVTITPVGGEIALPSPADDVGGYRTWVIPPLDTFRPSGAVVVELVRRCVIRSIG